MTGQIVDYVDFLGDARNVPQERVVAFLREELPYAWVEEYRQSTTREPQIVIVPQGTFVYVFDDYRAVIDAVAPDGSRIEARLVGACGLGSKPIREREASRMQGWIGPSNIVLGSGRDKGHFIGHSLGGLVDGFELNLFSQAMSVNRGRSLRGRVYRQMERHCARHPGTFCFSRPIYRNESSLPAMIEFGILNPDNSLWVEVFEN